MAQMPQPSTQEKAYRKYNVHTSASNQGTSNQSNKATITKHLLDADTDYMMWKRKCSVPLGHIRKGDV